MLRLLATMRCAVEGAATKNVKLGPDSRMNRSRLSSGLGDIKGTPEYPVQIRRSTVSGNVSIGYGTNILRSDLNAGRQGSVTIGRLNSVNGVNISAGNSTVTTGSFCSFADGSKFLTSGHKTNQATSYYILSHVFHAGSEDDIAIRGPVTVEDDVWIGSNAVVLGNVTVGRGAVVGAGSVVTQDVPRYGIVGGIPARLIRMRFPDEVINFLEGVRWWEWSLEKIHENRAFFEVDLLSDHEFRALLENMSSFRGGS